MTSTVLVPAPRTLTFSFPLGPSLRFLGLTAPVGWTCSTPAVGAGGTITCTRPQSFSGPQVFTVQATVAPGTPSSQLSVTASVVSDWLEPVTADNAATANLQVIVWNLTEAATAMPSVVQPGGNVGFAAVVTNAGRPTHRARCSGP